MGVKIVEMHIIYIVSQVCNSFRNTPVSLNICRPFPLSANLNSLELRLSNKFLILILCSLACQNLLTTDDVT